MVGSRCRRLCLAAGSLACVFVAASWVVRGCGGETAPLLRYAGYVALWVVLPGVVVLRAWRRDATGLQVLALGLPLGFAIEVFTWVAAGAAGMRPVVWMLPVVWGVLAWWQFRRRGGGSRVEGAPRVLPLQLFLLSLAVLLFVATTVALQFVASPLRGGDPIHPSHHDWIYLIGRVAELKSHWPATDPSLVGAPLAYHYFLLAHIAAASVVTGDEITVIFLRLAALPLGLTLVAQIYCLAYRISGRGAAGVTAVVLVLFAGEVCTGAGAGNSTFRNLFISFLFVSPTFFFGLIFSGWFLLVVPEALQTRRWRLGDGAILAVMAAAATGAKATVVPPLVLAAAGWALMAWLRNRRDDSFLLVKVTACLGAGFAAFYFPTMIGTWGAGDASFAPFQSIRSSPFWLNHQESWSAASERVFGTTAGRWVGELGLGVVVALGYSGVRILAWVYLLRAWRRSIPAQAEWLGWALLVQFAAGHLVALDSEGQLYLLYASIVPEAVLAAVVVAQALNALRDRIATLDAPQVRRARAVLGWGAVAIVVVLWWAASLPGGWALVLIVLSLWAVPSVVGADLREGSGSNSARPTSVSWRWPAVGVFTVAVVGAFQVNHWRLQTQPNFQRWWKHPAPEVAHLTPLVEALRWVRRSTPVDAVLFANAVTQRTAGAGGIAVLDDTTVDKYFFYSALAERRVWIEGPTYLRDRSEVERRLQLAEALFERGRWAELVDEVNAPAYLLIDRSISGVAPTIVDAVQLVFTNERVAVYEWKLQ